MTFRVATYNAGLAVGYLPHVTERVPHVIDALAALDGVRTTLSDHFGVLATISAAGE